MDQPALMEGLKALAATVDQAVTIVDSKGIVLEWNAAAERMYSIKRSSIVGREITGFFAPASLMVRRVLETGTPMESTYHQPRPGIHVLITAMPLYTQGKLVGALAVEREVTSLVEMSAELISARDQVSALKKRLTAERPGQPPEQDPFHAIKGRSPAVLRTIELARRIAPTEAITMIRGESGVGKELLAEGLHKASHRAKGPFVALNCGAIPPALFESELFGHAPGAYTGASPKGQPGKIELAEGGTIFLDEVGDLPLDSQVKLLRFLETRTFYRVGGTVPTSVDVRVLVATNRPLEEMVRRGTFRDDLYWRLNVVTLTLPPLRERKEDILDLIQMFIWDLGLKHGRSITWIDPAVTQRLLAHSWPGNIRELRNTVERMVVLSRDGRIGLDTLPEALREPVSPGLDRAAGGRAAEPLEGEDETPLDAAVARAERESILTALAASKGNRKAAASLLGISRGTLYNKCRRLGLDLQTNGERLQ